MHHRAKDADEEDVRIAAGGLRPLAGVGDRVLLLDEGGSARLILGDEKAMTIRAVVAAVVDRIDREGE